MTTFDDPLPVSAVDRGCAAVGDHLLEVERDRGSVSGWVLRCRGCLAEVARSQVGLLPDLPGLPITAALAVAPGAGTGGATGDTLGDAPSGAFTVALGRIAPACEHPPGAPARSGRGPRGRSAGVEFRAGLVPGLGVRRADPVVMPGGWWVAAARGAARSVTSQAFGIRHRSWTRSVERTACPEQPCPVGTRSIP